jgi:hypothetical protein
VVIYSTVMLRTVSARHPFGDMILDFDLSTLHICYSGDDLPAI